LFPEAPNVGDIVFSAFSPEPSLNIGFLGTLDFLNFRVLLPPPACCPPFPGVAYWAHPLKAPGILGQLSSEASPIFEDLPSADQGNETATEASKNSGRGGLLDLLFRHLRPIGTAPGGGPMNIPQRSLAFTADQVDYVVEFLDAHLTDGHFVWGAESDLRSMGINVVWPEVPFFGFTEHRFRAIGVPSGQTVGIDGVMHQVVHLYARNPSESYLTVLQDATRRL
jgi:hypothetical protein